MSRLTGLIAAAYTPFDAQGNVNLPAIGPMVDALFRRGVDGLYVCGSTGEGVSLSSQERRAVAREFIRAAAGRAPVVVQVGHNSLREAAALAADAAAAGATAISATCPSYFKINSVDVLIDSIAQIAAAAPDVPFYYYHIPAVTGVECDVAAFLSAAGQRMPNLAGLKFTSFALHEYQSCLQLQHRRFDVLWGHDEMLLGALAVGAAGAVGSTYNAAAPVYQELRRAFAAGDLETALACQHRCVEFIRTVGKFPFHPAMKEILRWQGIDCGTCRLPLPALRPPQSAQLRDDLAATGALAWLLDPA